MTREDFLVAYNIGHRDGKVDAYCPNDYDDIFDIKQQPNDNEQIIKVSKGALKARTGRYVIYDVEWLKEHFNTTEAKIYGQPEKRTEEHTEMHACDYISRQAVLEGLANIAKAKAKSDAQKSLMGRVMFFTEHLPPVTPQPIAEEQQKTGHWTHDGGYWENRWICSECGYKLYGEQSRFCPDCGIKMEEEKNERKTESEEI